MVKSKTSEKTITVKLIQSPVSEIQAVRDTIRGLGLRKLNQVSTLKDTPCVRGMINRVIHKVEVIK
jgi:large subunit ribosomal protein L30